MVLRDAMRNTLQHHCFASAGGGNHQSPLPLADWREEVDDASGVFLWVVLKGEMFLGIERGEVIEENLLAGTFRLFVIDCLNLEEGEIPLAFLRRAGLPPDAIPRPQVETPDLTRGDIDIVGARQII